MKKTGMACMALVALMTAALGGTAMAKEAYNTGAAEIGMPVREMEISWESGSVTIATHAAETVRIEEKSLFSLEERKQVHWKLENGELKILSHEPGLTSLFGNKKKDLKVWLPETLVLDELEIAVASASVNGVFPARELEIASSSGAIHGTTEANEIEIATASGAIGLTHTGTAEKVALATSSGKTECVLGTVRKFEASSASGRFDLKVAELTEKFKLETASGQTDVAFGAVSGKVGIGSASGKVTLTYPEGTGFTAKIKTASGKVRCEFPCIVEGRTYTAGDGSVQTEIDTASGSVTLACAK
ncbi:MAG: DUF4097 family beta strand repeat-containing protein [Clostridia bacterium]|nr:DUF4097 family beta strand repeat-containing protein [Clostridia bacterium]